MLLFWQGRKLIFMRHAKSKSEIPDAWYDQTVVELVPLGATTEEDEDDTTLVLRSWQPFVYAKTQPGAEV